MQKKRNVLNSIFETAETDLIGLRATFRITGTA